MINEVRDTACRIYIHNSQVFIGKIRVFEEVNKIMTLYFPLFFLLLCYVNIIIK